MKLIDLLLVLAVVLLIVGCGWMYPPAGLIAASVVSAALWYLLGDES